jgi:hypothetical protein
LNVNMHITLVHPTTKSLLDGCLRAFMLETRRQSITLQFECHHRFI